MMLIISGFGLFIGGMNIGIAVIECLRGKEWQRNAFAGVTGTVVAVAIGMAGTQ